MWGLSTCRFSLHRELKAKEPEFKPKWFSSNNMRVKSSSTGTSQMQPRTAIYSVVYFRLDYGIVSWSRRLEVHERTSDL